MPLPTPFTAPPIPRTDVLSLILDKPATGFEETRIMFKDSGHNSKPLTFADLRRSVRQFGTSLLRKVGVQAGDRVALFMVHGVHYPIALFGILCAGGQAVPMNPQSTLNDVLHYVKVTGLTTIVVDEAFYKQIAVVLRHLPRLKVIVRGSDLDKSFAHRHWHFETFLTGPEMDWPRGPQVNDVTALICFSSGTSGLPKAVMLSHQNIVACQHTYWHAAHEATFQRDGKLHQIILSMFPAFHAAGLWGTMVDGVYDGATTIVMQQFQLSRYLELLEENQPTELTGAPPLVLLLATHPSVAKYDFSCVQHITIGAAPLSKELSDACVQRVNPKIRMQQVWGMTELVCLGTASSLTHRFEELHRPGSVGYSLPFNEIKIVDPSTDKEIKPAAKLDTRDDAQRGEILIRGPSVFKGYLGMSKEQMAEFFTTDGYYRTGDIGVADQNGCLYIVDRLKELIKSSGFQVAPAEVEGILLTHPDIVDCAVVGIPDVRHGENVRAYIVLRPGSALTRVKPEEANHSINEWYNPQVMRYKTLKGGIRFVDAVPKSPAGKILRRLLRDQIAAEERQDKPKL